MLIPTEVVKTYPNNKPWVTKGVADVLKRRQEGFRRGSTEDVKRLQKEARKEILENKKKFRRKVEDSFASNNSRQLWSSLQTMTSYNPNKKSLVADDPRKLAHDPNCFYAHFYSTDFSAERAATLAEVNRMEQREEVLTEEEVSRCFRLVSQRSACGPYEIPGVVLKHCHDSLAPVFTTLFQRALESGHIPSIWKSSNVVPVPKKTSPSALNDYRPIALTSIPFKCMERIVLQRLHAATQSFQDPLQFAYTLNRNRGCYPDCDPCRFETPGEAKGLCPDALPGVLDGVQHNPASPADAEADGHGHQPRDHPLALQLPDRQATTCCGQVVDYLGGVIRGPHQHWSPSRMCALSCVVHAVHIPLPVYCQRHTSG